MSERGEILIGDRGADHVSFKDVCRANNEGWFSANIEVRCDGLSGKVAASFMKGELSRFAEDIRQLHATFLGIARLEPLEPNIVLTLTGDGKGHITVQGIARNRFERNNRLNFEFEIDQTYLINMADSLSNADPP